VKIKISANCSVLFNGEGTLLTEGAIIAVNSPLKKLAARRAFMFHLRPGENAQFKYNEDEGSVEVEIAE